MKRFHWKGYSGKSRMTAIEEIKGKIELAGGDIMDFFFYSDVSMTLQIEIKSDHCAVLEKELKSVMSLDAVAPPKELGSRVIQLYLNISFASGTGDLKQKVVDVPG